MKVINRADIQDDEYREILDVETHHDHQIIEDDHGTYRWKQNVRVRELVNKLGLNDLLEMFYQMGYDKNSEVYRKLYRDMGTSLFAYWEVFYWEVNNENASEYFEQMKSINRNNKLNKILNK